MAVSKTGYYNSNGVPMSSAAVALHMQQNPGVPLSTSPTGNIPASTSTKQQQQQQPDQQKKEIAPVWNLSSWNTTGTGSWAQQPVLTIDGQQFRFNTPQEYISKLQELQNIPGMTGPIGQFISQFQGAIPEYTRAAAPKVIQPIAPPTPVTPAPATTTASAKPNQALIDSEIARAQQVWNDADSLAGTGKYAGQTAQQIRDNAHQYAQGLRDGTQQPQPPTGTQTGTTTTPTTPAPTNTAAPFTPQPGATYYNSNGVKMTDAAVALHMQQNPGVPLSTTPPAAKVTTPVVTPPATTGTADIDAALKIIDSSSLPEAIKALYRQAVKSWDPTKSINAQNIIDTFRTISDTTIDPYFKELSKVAADTYSRSYQSGDAARKLELETEGANAMENIRQTKEALAKRGMTFSGEAVNALGGKSAFGQPGNPNVAIPTLVAPEGQINQSNRLVASSSQARYQKGLEDLARQAEAQLGSTAAGGIVPGVTPIGGITGTLPMQKTQQQANTLETLINQQNLNEQQKSPLTINV